MADAYKGRLAGHTLVREGGPHFDVGDGHIRPVTMKTRYAEPGRGLCSCGSFSDWLHSTNQRKAWHRQHKGDVVAKLIKATELEQ